LNILYGMKGCAQCMVLKDILEQKDIAFAYVTDKEELQKQNLRSVPWLFADGRMMKFGEALEWAMEQ